MNYDWNTLLSPLRVALLKSGLSDKVRGLEFASDPAKCRGLVILSEDESHLSGFQDWIHRAVQLNETLSVVCVTAPGDEDVLALADKVVAILPCGELVGLKTLEKLERLLLTRPAKSYAIVLAGAAAAIRDSEKLDFVDRSAWRLFVPEPKAPWKGQRLTDSSIFLWDNADAEEFLAPRLQADSEGLKAFLHSVADSKLLDRWRLERILGEIEVSVEERLANPQYSIDGTRLRLENVQGEIDSLEQTLKRRIAADRDHTKRLLKSSLQALEQRLREGWRCEVESLGLMSNSNQITQKLSEYNAAEVEGWLAGLRTELESERKNSMEEMTLMYSGLDWDVVNRSGEEGVDSANKYPERIDVAVRKRLISGSGPVPRAAEVTLPAIEGGAFRTVLATACIGAVAGFLVGGPIGGTVLGGLTALFTTHSSDRAQKEEIRGFGMQWLQQNIEQAHRQAEEWTVRSAESIEETLHAEFQILREKISELLVNIRKPEAVGYLRDVSAEVARIRRIVAGD